jgi:hypothetical protein
MIGATARTSWRSGALIRVSGLAIIAALVGGLGYVTNALADKQPAPKPPAGKEKPAPKKTEPKPIVDILAKSDGAIQVGYINEEIRKKWQETKINPSARCTDHEFIRRASLDIIGRIAKPDEIAKFLSDPPERRRSLLIERLLESEEYAKNWSSVWTVWLMTRAGSFTAGLKIYHEQMQVWLEEQFAKPDMQYDKIVTDLLTASGKTNENQAVNFILAHLGEPEKDDPQSNGRYNMVPITSRTTRLFLGLRTQCTQCHDHPFNDDWKQADFWGVNAFFRQVDAPRGRPLGRRRNQAMNAVLELVDDPNVNSDAIVYFERRNGVVLPSKPVFLDGRVKMPPLSKNDTRRKELAKFIIKSEYFPKAFINRMWAHFFGRGFTKVFDDFGEHNPVSHPELLDRLAEDFRKYNYRPRDLIRWICNSQAYGLGSTANETNDKEDAEPYFARMQLKAMSPEQLFESLMVATGAKASTDQMAKKQLRELWMKRLVDNFGDDEGNEATFNGTVVQALLMMNGEDINRAITDPKVGTVARVVSRYRLQPREAMRSLYLAALNRHPTTAEYTRILNPRMYNLPRVPVRDRGKFYTEFYQDLFWALLNSNEFILNH